MRKPKYAVVVIENGEMVFLAKRRTSDGVEKAFWKMRSGTQIRLWKDGEWVRCDE